MLQGINIHFCISDKPIIGEASVKLFPGQFTAIIGPNGAGKSTLFKLLSGDLTCSRGNILYNGRPIQKYRSKELAQIRAVMPQHTVLSFPFSAWEVVELGSLNAPREISQQDIQDVMERLQIWHLRDRKYSLLSGGEKQRIQLARVLIQIWKNQPFPRYLLLDEPISSMDVSLQHLVLAMLNDLKDRNIGVLAVLHDLGLVANYADQVIMMKAGSIAFQGNLSEVYNSKNLEKLFGYPIQVKNHESGMGVMVHSLPYHYINHTIKQAQ
ncbi:heme ABC transporter ATP-binding protein [Belliella sp. DSM 107340]|uniref:Heme ABC transporter ATP-binding protein n=1 Tax=Belliella calami TaxID=2923436 RepID=A0ABS9UNG6_9BACT|nr:heme ABC transporter ATP-binding protein [Belliella calami]MCH7398148.1 heme ABC transporter ATP-binding protein [Belliella calami]